MNMKKYLAGLALTAVSAIASAAPWTDTRDFNPDLLVPPSKTWTHDLRDNGFDVGIDTITSFSLNIRIKDDGGWLDNLFNTEIAAIDLPGGSAIFPDEIWTSAIGLNSYSGSQVGGQLSLNSFGILTVTVGSIFGDFLIDSSTLTAQGREGTTGQVPEPGSLALVGLALAGVALRRRQRREA